HKERKPFAYGLCNECYEEVNTHFIKVSGGLDGGSDPLAFQRAEKERLAKLSIEENAKGLGVWMGTNLVIRGFEGDYERSIGLCDVFTRVPVYFSRLLVIRVSL
ncbi:hypothetical protein Gotri_023170, partial [Gossypium trilobum]|nr:hypothetical protein [Gossypium trilobum]